MTQKTKSIIIIISAIAVFAMIVSIMFDLFGGKKTPDGSVVEQEREVILPNKDEDLPEGEVFDASNTDKFLELIPSSSGGQKNPLELEAEELAVFFVERIGTYSSDSGFAYINDLYGFMTQGMSGRMDEYKKNSPKREDYYSISTDAEAISVESFSLASRSAVFKVVLKRNEIFGSSSETYSQEALVYLKQDSAGQWKVDNIVWGERI